ncbi:MAG: OsmC family protein, partial [Halobacteriales archaeon]|nr:OsmC family protein [Halobacteriales archaeon]
MAPGPFRVDVLQRDHFRFDVVFDEKSWAPVVVDEPEPLGEGAGPNAARLLAGAVGNCLAASLLLCLEKSRFAVGDLRATVEGTMERNEQGRFRIGKLDVTVAPMVEGDGPSPRFDRCLEIFEDFCIVTQSVRDGIDVDVRVEPEWMVAEGVSEGG